MNELTSVVLVSHLRIGILLSTLWYIKKIKGGNIGKAFCKLQYTVCYRNLIMDDLFEPLLIYL